jgi:hypothetical protein
VEFGRHKRNRGRGAGLNPAGRFEPVEIEADPEAMEEEPLPTTRFYEDASRSIITRNDSPDIPFSASLNPYRGCEHGCAYCMSGDTPILMGDGGTHRLEDLRVGDEIYGTFRGGWYRRYTKTRVLAHWSTIKSAYRVILEDGKRLICSGDHRFLTERGWKFVRGTEQGETRRPHLTSNNKLMGVGYFASPPEKDYDYRRGYLCGIIGGDGHLASYRYERAGRAPGDQHQFRRALSNEEALAHASRYLLDFEAAVREFVFQEASVAGKKMRGIRTSAQASVEIVEWPDTYSEAWRKGFLAGIFDAEGGYHDGILRISNMEHEIVGSILRCLDSLGFECVSEERSGTRKRSLTSVRIRGGLEEHLRFFHTVDPAIGRKRDISGQALKSSADLRVASIEPLGAITLYDRRAPETLSPTASSATTSTPVPPTSISASRRGWTSRARYSPSTTPRICCAANSPPRAGSRRPSP